MKTGVWLPLVGLLAGACHPTSVAPPATNADQARAAARERSDQEDGKPRPREEGTAGTPLPRTPAAALEPGQLRQIQRRLAERKLLGEHEDGNLDAPTRSALRRLQ